MKKSDIKLLAIGVVFLIAISSIIYLLVTRIDNDIYVFDMTTEQKARYNANEVIYVYMDEKELVKNYYSDIVNMLVFSPEEAYKLVKPKVKEEEYPTLELFTSRVNEMIENGLYEGKLLKYTINIKDDKNIYYITDTKGNNITVLEESIMDYQIII